jgi:hypothetical protein
LTGLSAYVDALARRIDAGWRAAGHRQPAFPEIAAAALQELPAVGEIDAQKLVAAVLHDDGLRRAGAHSSDTVVPLFEGNRFTISAHVWLDEIGQPHGHAWNGAFQIASGNVVHATYDFAEHWRHDARLRIGALYQRELAVLVPGETIAVEAGATIHALCHVERPSLSVVVRAYDEPDQQTIDYWRPGLAIESGVGDPLWAPALRCLRLVQHTEPARVPALVRELLPRLDARGVVEILRAALDGGTDFEAILALGQDGPHRLREHATVLTAALEDMLRHSAFERARARRRDHDDRWIQARRIWTQHAYYVTNVREDSTIPQAPEPNWKTLNTFRTNAQIENGGLCMPTPAG